MAAFLYIFNLFCAETNEFYLFINLYAGKLLGSIWIAKIKDGFRMGAPNKKNIYKLS